MLKNYISVSHLLDVESTGLWAPYKETLKKIISHSFHHLRHLSQTQRARFYPLIFLFFFTPLFFSFFLPLDFFFFFSPQFFFFFFASPSNFGSTSATPSATPPFCVGHLLVYYYSAGGRPHAQTSTQLNSEYLVLMTLADRVTDPGQKHRHFRQGDLLLGESLGSGASPRTKQPFG